MKSTYFLWSRREGAVSRYQFWNGKSHRMEVYVISEDKFYTINGVLIEE